MAPGVEHDRRIFGQRSIDDDWYLVTFSSRLSAEGFAEEDGELWSRDGRLLAQSRQLALVLVARA